MLRLAFRAGWDIAQHDFISKETWLDAVDMGAWFIPVAGGLYDVGMAIYGKDLNGREMSAADRWIRWGVWLGTAVLDVFTFGAGGTAIRAWVKGTQVTAKVVKSAVKTEKAVSYGTELGVKLYKWAKTFTHGAMFTGLCYGVGVNIYDIAVSTDEVGKVSVDKIKAVSEKNTSIPV